MTELRKIFYYENDKNAPILAAGVLFVSKKKGIINVLIQKEYNNNNNKFYIVILEEKLILKINQLNIQLQEN
jgi:hypothetical protein